MSLALKICGMLHNTAEVARLQPDYLGFIFYEKSPRYVSHSHIESLLPESNSIKTTKNVGVFVNASVNFIIKQCKAFNLNVIQLHGEESVAFIKSLNAAIHSDHSLQPLKLWKVFSIKDHFNFDVLKDFEAYVDAFLFDTKGKDKGGNGYTFNWSVLKDYPSTTPIILSGGIGIEHIEELKALLKLKLPITAIDVNSKFEDKPGLKNIELLSRFKEQLKKEQLI